MWLTFLACQALAVIFGLVGCRYRLGKFTAAGAVVLLTVVFLGQYLSEYDAAPSPQRPEGWGLAVPTPQELEPDVRRFLDYVIAGQWNEAAAEMVSYAMPGVRGGLGVRAGYLQIEAEKSDWYPILKKSTPETLQQARANESVEATGWGLDGSGPTQISSCEYDLILPPPPSEPDTPSISLNLRFVVEDGHWKVEYMSGGVIREVTGRRMAK